MDRQATLEMVHFQAVYFQNRFPLLSWAILDSPPAQFFITTDRPVVWGAEGFEADAPPGLLKHSAVQVMAPLTRTVALVGQPGAFTETAAFRPTEINSALAQHAESWVAGPTPEVVATALESHYRARGRSKTAD